MRKIYKLLVLTCALLIITSATSYAQSEGSKGTQLRVSPVVVEKNAAPGDTINETIFVTNTSDVNTLYIRSSVLDFYYDNDGEIKFIDDTEDSDVKELNAFSLKKWITVNFEGSISPGATKEIPIQITVPADAIPGGHYATLFLTADPSGAPLGSKVGVHLGGEVGVLLLVTIPGDYDNIGGLSEKLRAGTLNDDSIFNPKWLFLGGKGFENGPAAFRFKFSNDSPAHFAPEGYVTVTNTFGKTVGTFPIKQTRVFPGTERYIVTEFPEKKFYFGMYKAELQVYDKARNVFESRAFFFGLPWLLLIIIVGSISTIYLILRLHERSIRRKVIRELAKKSAQPR